jgi:hypothetical protein
MTGAPVLDLRPPATATTTMSKQSVRDQRALPVAFGSHIRILARPHVVEGGDDLLRRALLDVVRGAGQDPGTVVGERALPPPPLALFERLVVVASNDQGPLVGDPAGAENGILSVQGHLAPPIRSLRWSTLPSASDRQR